MTRLAATLRLDVMNQYRQGFYLAMAVVLVFLVGFASLLPIEAGALIPAILLTNMTIATYAFVGGLVLLEKGEGTLESIIVSPLRPEEYLGSKIITLTGLAVLENAAIVAIAIGAGLLDHVNWGWILLGSALTGALYTLLGFLTVIRYDSMNDFLMPMMFVTLFLELPAGVIFGMPEFHALIILPTYALLWIFRAAVEPVSAWVMIYAIGYPLLWLAVAFLLGRNKLREFVAGRIGKAYA
jgi:fluoroquinolone transport system permease protein